MHMILCVTLACVKEKICMCFLLDKNWTIVIKFFVYYCLCLCSPAIAGCQLSKVSGSCVLVMDVHCILLSQFVVWQWCVGRKGLERLCAGDGC